MGIMEYRYLKQICDDCLDDECEHCTVNTKLIEYEDDDDDRSRRKKNSNFNEDD